MYAEIQKLLHARAELLVNGQFDDLASLYQFPFVAFLDDVPTIIQDRAQGIQALSRIADMMASRGVVVLDVEVTSLELPRNGRYRVWCRYTEIDSRGKAVSQSNVVQYLVDTPNGPRVEMLESHKCPLADIWKRESSLAL